MVNSPEDPSDCDDDTNEAEYEAGTDNDEMWERHEVLTSTTTASLLNDEL